MLTIEQIIEATKGHLIGNGNERKIRGFSTDSRAFKHGEIFIAIKGEKFDGHSFIKEVIHKGASALIVSKLIRQHPSIPVIVVKDTTKALGDIALFYRCQFSIPVIAVTGSTGKTTTKEMIAAVLGTQFKVLKNIKTENNQYGVPLTLLQLNHSYEAAVLELGTNQPGDIEYLSRITKPTIAVYTNIGESHLAKLSTPQGVFKEKMNLLKYTLKEGMAVYNNDDGYLKNISGMLIEQKRISYGIKNQAKFRAQHITKKGEQILLFKIGKKEFQLTTPVEHNIYNALAAISCGWLLGINMPRMQRALEAFHCYDGRLKIEKKKNYWIMDDTYNANPVSFRSAIQTLDHFKSNGKKILICADMLELGRRARALHELMGQLIAKTKIDIVLAIGKYTKYLIKTIQKVKRNNAYFHRDLNELHNRLRGFCRPGDVILVKGSRAMHMERTIEFLKKNLN